MKKEHVLYPSSLKPGDWAVCRYTIGQINTLATFDDGQEVETMHFDSSNVGKMVQGLPVFPLTLKTLDLTRFFQAVKTELAAHPYSGILNWHEIDQHFGRSFDMACREPDAGVLSMNDIKHFLKATLEFLEMLSHKNVYGVKLIAAKGGHI